MSERIGGYVNVKIDSKVYLLDSKVDYKISIPKREIVYATDGSKVGYTEKPEGGYIEFTIFNTKDVDVNKLIDNADKSITVELANGKTVTGTTLTYVGEGKGESEKGTFSCKYEGKVEEIK